MLKAAVFAGGILLLASQAAAQPVKSGEEKWGPPPAGLPTGSQVAVLAGDPGKAGPFVIRVKMPAGYTVPPHSHPTTENVTVVSGEITIGMGDKLDPKAGSKLGEADFISLGAKMNHFATTSAGAVIQISAEGPFAITYVNPADDPRGKR